jgi:hypothetical protein
MDKRSNYLLNLKKINIIMDEFYILENCNLINSKNVCELYLDFCIAITDCDSKNGGKEIINNIEEFLKS